MATCSYPSARLGELAFAWNKSMVARAEGDVRNAVSAFPLDGLEQRPSAFTRHSVVTIVVSALVAFAAWAFLPVCLQIRFCLHIFGCRVQRHMGTGRVVEHAVHIVLDHHYFVSLLQPLEGADAVDKCAAESPWPHFCLSALAVFQIGVHRASSASHAFKVAEQQGVRSHAVCGLLGRKAVNHLSEGTLVHSCSYHPRVCNYLWPRRFLIHVRPLRLLPEEVSTFLELQFGNSATEPSVRKRILPSTVPPIEMYLEIQVGQLAVWSAKWAPSR